MKKLLIAMTLVLFTGATASAETIKLGVLFGYTGPIESLTPGMAKGAKLAIQEVSDSSTLLGGAKVESVRGDSTCTDSAAARAAVELIGPGESAGNYREILVKGGKITTARYR